MAKLKILAIEDDEAVVKPYELALSADIFELKTAINGKEGLESYEDWRPDIILLDIVMPVLIGSMRVYRRYAMIWPTRIPLL